MTIDLNTPGDSLNIGAEGTIDNETINIGAPGVGATLTAFQTLQLGPGPGLREVEPVVFGPGTLVDATFSGYIQADPITNQGTIEIESGGTLSVEGIGPNDSDDSSSVFTNTGSMVIAPFGTFDLLGTATLPGLGAISNAGLFLIGGVNTAIEPIGTLDLAGGILTLGTGATLGNMRIDGELTDGTVVNNGGTDFIDGTLTNLTWLGTLNITAAGNLGAGLQNVSALSLDGKDPGVINVTAGSGVGPHVTLGGAVADETINLEGDGTTLIATDLTLAASSTLNSAGELGLGIAIANILSGDTLVTAGTIQVSGGPFSLQATSKLTNSGVIETTGTDTIILINGPALANSGTIAGQTVYISTQQVTNTGQINADSGGTVEFNNLVNSAGDLGFNGAAGLIRFDTLQGNSATINNWISGDQVELRAAGTYTIDASSTGSTLIIDQNGVAALTLAVGGGHPLSDFSITTGAGAFSSLVGASAQSSFINLACYARGTRITTPDGETPIELLNKGDEIGLASGKTAVIRWIGSRHVKYRLHPNPEPMWPVRVQAHAFGANLPRRDLVLSPDHAVFVDDVLIPIRYLINGTTIRRDPSDEVDFHHLQLDHHDIMLAEGLPAETYLNNGRDGPYPVPAAIWETTACAPIIVTGAKLQAVRARLHPRRATIPFASSIGSTPPPNIISSSIGGMGVTARI